MAEKIKSIKVHAVEKVEEETVIPQVKEKKKFNFENLSFWTIGAVVFLMPIFFLPVSIIGSSQAKLTLLALGTLLAFCFLLIDRMKKGVVTLTLNPIYITASILSVVYFVSSWVGISQYKSLIGSMTEQDTFITIFIGFLFMFLLSRLAKTSKKIFTILSLLFGSIVVAMFFQIARIIVGNPLSLSVLTSPSITLVGSWGDITILSLLLLASLVIILETVKLKRWVALSLGLLLIVPFLFVVLSGLSFDFYFFGIGLLLLIAIASIVIFAYLFSLRRSHKAIENAEEVVIKKKSKVSASLVLLLISILLVLFGTQVNSYLSKITGVTYVEGRPNWQATLDVSSKVLAQKPFFGSGPNTFDVEWDLNRAQEVNNYIFWNNEYNFGVGFVPTSLTTVGIVGFLFWLLFYIFVLILASKTLFGLGKREEGTIMSIIISVGAILSSLVLMFYAPGIVVVFVNGVLIALLVALNAGSFKVRNINFHGKQWHNFVSTIGFVILLIVTIYVMYIVAFKALANAYYRAAILSSDVDSALGLIQKSVILDPTQSLYYQTEAQVYAAKVSSALSLSDADLANKKDEINKSIVSAVNASVYAEGVNPTDYKAKVMTGKILEFFGSIGLKDASQGAIQKYIAASAQAPTNPLPLLFAANVALNINNKPLAKDYLTRAITLKSDYTDVPELGKEIQGLVDQLNKASAPVVVPAATSTSAIKEKVKEKAK
ncbi:MAG: ral transcriptional co-repressor, acts together with Tup1p, glucose repression mediator protein [Candidatus Taylorbacteria bacterium]|nr:ral transcriptional co-repressor, acts together with Tup1p, glucose repression mediator protein [Candidatus Taylorbacteria bacterium]